MRFEGTLRTWNEERGFGFIEPDQGEDQLFVHIKSMVNREGRPQVNQRFSFEVEPGPQGKKRATKVLPAQVAKPIVNNKQLAESPAQWGTATLFAIPLFLVLYTVVAVMWRPSAWVGLLYLGASLITFLAYAMDKAAAARRAQRISEKTLHLLALAGGWPGALLAQQFLRHKSTKVEFRSVFWATVLVNVGAFVAACSPMARALWPRGSSLTLRSRRGPTAGHQARAGGTRTFSPARAWRPAVGPASTQTLGRNKPAARD